MLKAQTNDLLLDNQHQWTDSYSFNQQKQNNQWLLLKNHDEKLHYRFDSVAEFFGREDSKYDGVGFCFNFQEPLQPGTCLDVALPMPRNMRPYQAEVVSCTEVLSSNEQNKRYEIGIWLRIDSELDLISIKNSCDYINRI